MIITAWWLLLYVAETCSCYHNCNNKICTLAGPIYFVMYSTSTTGVPYIKIRKWAQTTKFVTHFVQFISKTTRLKLTTGCMIFFTRWATCLKHFCFGKYLANYGRIWLKMRTGSHIVFLENFLIFSYLNVGSDNFN